MIIGRIERIGTIKQSFELTTHLIIIDGRSEYDYIGIVHFGHDCGGIIVDNAVLCFLTGETSFAETDVFSLIVIFSTSFPASEAPLANASAKDSESLRKRRLDDMTNTFFIVLFLYYFIPYLYTLSKIDVQSSPSFSENHPDCKHLMLKSDCTPSLKISTTLS